MISCEVSNVYQIYLGKWLVATFCNFGHVSTSRIAFGFHSQKSTVVTAQQ